MELFFSSSFWPTENSSLVPYFFQEIEYENSDGLREYEITTSISLCMLSRAWLNVTPWTVTHQASLSMEFLREEYWSELPFPSAGDLPNSGIKHVSLVSPALAGGFFTIVPPGKPFYFLFCIFQIGAPVGCHCLLHCVKVKSESEVAQSHPTYSDRMDCSLPGSSIHGIF